jgi:hypothetical protein
MRRILATALATVGLAVFSGCMPVYSPAIGVIFTDVYGPLDAGERVGTKEGTACAQSILGLIAIDDASIKEAARNGGITKIDSVDHHSTNILGIIGKFCTIVRGS